MAEASPCILKSEKAIQVFHEDVTLSTTRKNPYDAAGSLIAENILSHTYFTTFIFTAAASYLKDEKSYVEDTKCGVLKWYFRFLFKIFSAGCWNTKRLLEIGVHMNCKFIFSRFPVSILNLPLIVIDATVKIFVSIVLQTLFRSVLQMV